MNMTINNGSNVTFNCVSFSYAPVNYTWLKDGVTLLNDDVNIIITIDNDEDDNMYTTTLMILDVQSSDDGVYVCSATNRWYIAISNDAISNDATLYVIGKLTRLHIVCHAFE